MTRFLTQDSSIPPYMAYPRFLLDKDGLNETVLWSSFFVTLVAKKYHESVTLPSGLRMVYDNH